MPGFARRLALGCGAVTGLLLAGTWVSAYTMPQDLRIPPVKERKSPPAAMFSHWQHNTQYCYTCHPSIFPQRLEGFSHAAMKEGRYCGSCHDGRQAPNISAMSCEACHAP